MASPPASLLVPYIHIIEYTYLSSTFIHCCHMYEDSEEARVSSIKRALTLQVDGLGQHTQTWSSGSPRNHDEEGQMYFECIRHAMGKMKTSRSTRAKKKKY